MSPKPFNMSELMARVGALLRRAPVNGGFRDHVYQFGPIRVDLRATEVTRSGKRVDLSAREFQLLRFLIEHRGETLRRDVLLKDVWGYGSQDLYPHRGYACRELASSIGG